MPTPSTAVPTLSLHDALPILLQQQADHAVPEPGRKAIYPGMERLLARLVDIVPELAELGEPQALVGDVAGPVIDHEDEAASEQRSEEHTSELQSRENLVCRLL